VTRRLGQQRDEQQLKIIGTEFPAAREIVSAAAEPAATAREKAAATMAHLGKPQRPQPHPVISTSCAEALSVPHHQFS
jgi:hypothetical protein